METQVKETVAQFLRISPESISASTPIDRSALGNSILLHRMYARFAQLGFDVNDYGGIQNFGQLVQRLSGNTANDLIPSAVTDKPTSGSVVPDSTYTGSAIGIDIEDVASFEEAGDFRDHPFYKKNYTQQEISYCILQPNPLQSFAGLFAAKEAVVKADNIYKGQPFNQLEILHDPNGKPYFNNIAISISHTTNSAAAVAVTQSGASLQTSFPDNGPTKHETVTARRSSKWPGYFWVSILISLLSLLISTYLYVSHK